MYTLTNNYAFACIIIIKDVLSLILYHILSSQLKIKQTLNTKHQTKKKKNK